ncbi:MAG: MATE family efflux transporter [Eubacterium sp.]
MNYITKNHSITKKVFLGLLLTIILSKLSNSICYVVDTMVIGNFFSAECLSAIGFARPIVLIRSAVVYVISIGAVYMCAFYIGKNQREKVDQIFSAMMICAFFVGGIFTVVLVGFPEAVASILGANGDVHTYTSAYLRGFGIGMVPCFLNAMLVGLNPLNGSKDLVLKSTLLLGVSNILMDLIFALFTPLGLFGIAFSTSVSYLLAFCVNILHFRRPYNIFHLVPCFSATKDLLHGLKRGLPQGIYRLGITINSILFNAILFSAGGDKAIALIAIINSIHDVIVSAFIIGTSGVMNTLIALFYGEEDAEAIKETLQYTLKVQILIPGFSMLMLIIFAQPIIAMFGIDVAAWGSVYVLALRIYALSFVPRAIVNVFASVYNVIEKENLSIVMNSLQLIVFAPLIAWLLSTHFGIAGVFAAYSLGAILVLLLLMLFIYLKKRKLWSIENWMLLPKDFGGKKEDRLTFSLKYDGEGYLPAVEKIENFCQSHGVSKRSIIHVTLCTEEILLILASNNKDNKEHSLDVRILIKEDYLTLRIRDNNIRFDPFERTPSSDPFENIELLGVKLVKALVNEYEYNYSVDMNNVFIKLPK